MTLRRGLSATADLLVAYKIYIICRLAHLVTFDLLIRKTQLALQ